MPEKRELSLLAAPSPRPSAELSTEAVLSTLRRACAPSVDSPYLTALEWRLFPGAIRIVVHSPAARTPNAIEQDILRKRLERQFGYMGLEADTSFRTGLRRRVKTEMIGRRDLWPDAALGVHTPERIRSWVSRNIPKGCIKYSLDFADILVPATQGVPAAQDATLTNIGIMHTSLPAGREGEFEEFLRTFERIWDCPIVPVITPAPFDPYQFIEQKLGLEKGGLVTSAHIPALVQTLQNELAEYTIPERRKAVDYTHLQAFSIDGDGVQRCADVFAFEQAGDDLLLHVAIPDEVRRSKPWKKTVHKVDSLLPGSTPGSFPVGKVQYGLVFSWKVTDEALIPVGHLERCRIASRRALPYGHPFLRSHEGYQKLKKVLDADGQTRNDGTVVEALMSQFYQRAGEEFREHGVPFLTRERLRLGQEELSALANDYEVTHPSFERLDEMRRNMLLIDLLHEARTHRSWSLIPRILTDLIGRGSSARGAASCPLKGERGCVERVNQVSAAAHLDGFDLPKEFRESLYADALTPIQIGERLSVFEAKRHFCRLIALIIEVLRKDEVFSGEVKHRSNDGHCLVEVPSLKRWVRLDKEDSRSMALGDIARVRLSGFSPKHNQFIAKLEAANL